MGKKTIGRHVAKPAFRESDFAGHTAREQADLSGSLNQLNQQLVATRKLLQDIEASSPTIAPLAETPPQTPASDDDPPAPG